MRVQSLRIFFWIVLVSMLAVTSWASWHESVFTGGGKLLREPWGVATLFDTYFGFFTFYILIFIREKPWLHRLAWLVAVILLGNIAMAVYGLWALRGKPGQQLVTA